MWRDVFLHGLNPEVFLDSANLRALVRRAGFEATDRDRDKGLEGALDALRAWAVSAVDEWRRLLETVRATDDEPTLEARRDLDQSLIAQSAPLAASLGAWLQGLSAPGNFENPVYLKILALLADDLGSGRPEAARHDAFRSIARRMGFSDYAGAARELIAERSIRDDMFRLPGLLYALSRRSDAFAPELAGIDLGFRTIGMLPVWRALADTHDDRDWARLDLSRPQKNMLGEGETPLGLSAMIAERLDAASEGEGRAQAGVIWLTKALKAWNRTLHDIARATIDPRLAMALLVQERAREASVYHQDAKLEGKSLADWFREAQADPLPLVDALGRSRFVKPGLPRRSMLVNSLIRPQGRMFRIFRDEDVALMRRWIASLASDSTDAVEEQGGATHEERPLPFAVVEAGRGVGQGDMDLGVVPRTIREAYHLLQGRALAPRTRDFAADYCRFWLDRARASIGKSDRSLPETWFPGEVRAWLLDAHDKHGVEFEEHRNDEMPSREEVIEQTLQLAPLTLIDGSWLQGFTDVALASTRIGAPLFEIYWDELGNGDWRINHPKIYRDVLKAMDIELPPTGAAAFAQDSRLKDSSFRLPVYWLCLGKFPVTFGAEVLGMNLAMELSGVGGTYRSARRFLKHYRFPTVFVDIHNTIDNVSTGHSAWAADAIDAYMQTVATFGDSAAEWERVRAGYESLAPIVEREGDLDYFRKMRPTTRPAAAASPDAVEALHHHPAA